MKKLINNPRHLVREVLEGLADTTPGLALLQHEDVIVRHDERPAAERDVAVISGGGSGHEPAHAGYVGSGMLAAAIAGDVFTSPSVDAILSGVKAAAGPRGAVLIVKNYTGDRLNFGLAAELASADGIPTEVVVVADDVALRDVVPEGRRRGIAGTVLVHKIAGAAAAQRLPVGEVAARARRAARQVGSMGVGLGPCTVPSVGKPGFVLADDEIELGLGIHGEAGVGRMKIETADALVERMLDAILSDRGIGQGARVAILVNGLGGTSPIELAVVARHALRYARSKGLVVERLYTGVYLSALEMPGCSISVLAIDDDLLAALDAPTQARAWTSDGRIAGERRVLSQSREAMAYEGEPGPQAERIRRIAGAVAHALIVAEGPLADLDGRAGDGDLGASMVRGAEAILTLPQTAFATPALACKAMADSLRRAIAGSSGPFYAVALTRAAKVLEGKVSASPEDWLEAFTGAVEAIEALGGAQSGDRTMVDALRPAAAAWSQGLASGLPPAEAFAGGVQAAREGADATAAMLPRLGRASYLGERALGVPDAGATAVAMWLEAIERAQ